MYTCLELLKTIKGEKPARYLLSMRAVAVRLHMCFLRKREEETFFSTWVIMRCHGAGLASDLHVQRNWHGTFILSVLAAPPWLAISTPVLQD